MRLQIPCQRESWDLNYDTRAAMTIVLSVQGYYITDFGAFALEFPYSVHNLGWKTVWQVECMATAAEMVCGL